MLDYAIPGILDFAASDHAAPRDKGRHGGRQHPPRLLIGELKSLCEKASYHAAVKEGGTLVNKGENFRDLYAVRAGSFKACIYDAQGRERRLGLFMPGDIIGFDAMETGRHSVSFVALERSDVVAIPFDALDRFSKKNPGLLAEIMRRMVRKIAQA